MKILKILIVDDEALIREWLEMCALEVGVDMGDIYQAQSGEEAMRNFSDQPADLIFCDLTMGKMDGLTLIEHIRSKNKDVKIIILTCHDEFDFARRAMFYGVSRYLLKNELSKEDVKEIMISNLESAICDTNSNISGKNEVIIKKERNRADIFQVWENKANLIIAATYAMGNIAGIQLINNHIVQSGIFIKQNSAVVIFVFELYDKTKEEIEGVKNVLLESGISIQEVGSVKKIESLDLQECIKITINKLNKKFWEYSDEITVFEGQESRMTELYKILDEYTLEIIADIKYKKSQESVEKVKECIEVFKENHELAIFQFKQYFIKLIAEIFNQFVVNNYVEIEVRDSIERMDTYTQMQDIMEGLIYNIDIICDVTQSVVDAKLYIEKNYFKALSLSGVANHVYLNKDYFSRLFKKETDMTFTDYVNKVRMERAKKMVCETNTNINEIADMIGIPNSSYFSSTFTKFYGESPSAMRYRIMGGEVK